MATRRHDNNAAIQPYAQHVDVDILPPVTTNIAPQDIDNRAIVHAAERSAIEGMRSTQRIAAQTERRMLASRTLGTFAENAVQTTRDAWLVATLAVGGVTLLAFTIVGGFIIVGSTLRANDVNVTVPTVTITR